MIEAIFKKREFGFISILGALNDRNTGYKPNYNSVWAGIMTSWVQP